MEIKNSSPNKVIKITNKKIKCPNCKKMPLEPYVPFCSKKCSDLDLLKWLSNESYIQSEKL